MDYTLNGNSILNNIWQKMGRLFIPSQDNNFKPAFLQSSVLLYIVIAILSIKIITIALYLPISHNVFFADITKIDLLNLLNQNRQDLGLNPLKESGALDQAAYLKAQDMVKNGYFAHQSPQGISPWFWFLQAGYKYHYAGENLAVGFLDSKAVYDAWFNSPSHKENLLNSHYTEVGTAVVTGFEGNSILVVQEFASPLVKPVNAPAPAKPVATKPAPKPTSPQKIVAAPEETPAPKASNLVSGADSHNSSVPTPKVLAQSTEYIMANSKNTGDNSLYLKFLNFIVYDSNAAFTYVSQSLLILLAFCLALNIILIFNMGQSINTTMLLRPLLLIAILGLSVLLDSNVIAYILPYQISI